MTKEKIRLCSVCKTRLQIEGMDEVCTVLGHTLKDIEWMRRYFLEKRIEINPK